MRRNILSFVASGLLVLGACAPAEVVVTAQIEQEGPEEGATQTLALGDVIVELIPFDRDVIFDSLENIAATPEPEIPPDLLAAQEQIREAQERWQSLETRWNTLRDTLQQLSEELEQYSRGESRYVALFQEWQDLDAEYQRIDRQVEQAFERYDSLTRANLAQTQEVRIQRENWAAEAFADAPDIFDGRLQATGREIYADTTSANGIARFRGMRAGEWWIHARYELPTTELYWNVPISVPKGEIVEVSLTRANAEERPKL